jgi:site-specific DNA-methyltransferase (adenine-specific)
VRLICGDCLEVLPTLAEASVDAVVADPPYGQTNEAYDRGVNPAVWRECFRVAKPNAALLSFTGSPTYHRIASGIEAAGWRVRQMWAWVYRDGMITSAYPKEGFDRLAPAMDPICFATKGKVLLNVEREGEADWARDRTTPKSLACISERSGGRPAAARTGRYPRTIVSDGAEPFGYFALPRAGRYRESDHPNEKPLALMRWLLSKLPPGGVVLDPFMGSATTGVVCREQGRDFVGVEKDAAYFAIAEKRLADTQTDAPLFAAAAAGGE